MLYLHCLSAPDDSFGTKRGSRNREYLSSSIKNWLTRTKEDVSYPGERNGPRITWWNHYKIGWVFWESPFSVYCHRQMRAPSFNENKANDMIRICVCPRQYKECIWNAGWWIAVMFPQIEMLILSPSLSTRSPSAFILRFYGTGWTLMYFERGTEVSLHKSSFFVEQSGTTLPPNNVWLNFFPL
jgi:hypothetical protein